MLSLPQHSGVLYKLITDRAKQALRRPEFYYIRIDYSNSHGGISYGLIWPIVTMLSGQHNSATGPSHIGQMTGAQWY